MIKQIIKFVTTPYADLSHDLQNLRTTFKWIGIHLVGWTAFILLLTYAPFIIEYGIWAILFAGSLALGFFGIYSFVSLSREHEREDGDGWR